MQNRITAKCDNKGLASVGMDIGRGLTKELYIAVCNSCRDYSMSRPANSPGVADAGRKAQIHTNVKGQ